MQDVKLYLTRHCLQVAAVVRESIISEIERLLSQSVG